MNKMNTAKIVAITQPLINDQYGQLSVDEFIAYVARVSNPSNQNNTLTAPKLLRYLVKHKHWSPFEMVHVCMEITTTRDIGRQILRHRSFSFQEFSQRYANVGDISSENIFREPRLQDKKNRQNSVETSDEELQRLWNQIQSNLQDHARLAYGWAIDNGIAKEQARVVLPEGLTSTRMYMSGSLRSWIHYCQLRTTSGTQKEHRQVAETAWWEIQASFPSLIGLFSETQE